MAQVKPERQLLNAAIELRRRRLQERSCQTPKHGAHRTLAQAYRIVRLILSVGPTIRQDAAQPRRSQLRPVIPSQRLSQIRRLKSGAGNRRVRKVEIGKRM